MPRPKLSSLSLRLAYLLVLLAFTIVYALPSPFTISSPSGLPQRRADPDSQPCGFDGDDNIYGLGIRLGLYLQGITTILSCFLGPEEAKNMRDVNFTFQLSVFGGLLYVTATHGIMQEAGQLYAAEVLVMLNLCSGGVLYPIPEPDERAFFNVVQSVFNLATLSYSLWFFFTGMDQMAHPPCSRYAFFLAKADMYHWYRVVRKILAILWLVIETWLLLWTLDRRTRDPQEFDGFLVKISDPSSKPRLTTQAVAFALIVASTELTIRWNHINNVHSIGGTGQLIPLLVGCMSFVRIVYVFYARIVDTVERIRS